jgi:hypothetical protein
MAYKLESGCDDHCENFATDNGFVIVTKKNFRNTHYQHENQLISNCKNEIGEGYIMANYDYVFGNKPKNSYDGVLILNNNNDACGFLFTKIIHCPSSKFNNLPILNLICSKQCTTKTKTTVSRLMMYIYLNSLLFHNIPYGTLELADGVNNAPGYCLYSKYGFKADVELVECVPSICLHMLPMSVNMNTLNQQKLYNITFKDKNEFPKQYECRSENFSKKDKLNVIKKQREDVIQNTINKLKLYINNKKLTSSDLVKLQTNMISALDDISNKTQYDSNNDMPQKTCKNDESYMKLQDYSNTSQNKQNRPYASVDQLQLPYRMRRRSYNRNKSRNNIQQMTPEKTQEKTRKIKPIIFNSLSRKTRRNNSSNSSSNSSSSDNNSSNNSSNSSSRKSRKKIGRQYKKNLFKSNKNIRNSSSNSSNNSSNNSNDNNSSNSNDNNSSNSSSRKKLKKIGRQYKKAYLNQIKI